MRSSREWYSRLGCVLLVFFVLPCVVSAATIFESFDAPLTSPPWSWQGTLGYANASSGVTPTNGTDFAYVTTSGSSFTGAQIMGGNGNQSSTNGSVLWQDFTFDGTSEVSFDVMFATQENPGDNNHERDMGAVALLPVPTGAGCCTGLDATHADGTPPYMLFSARVRQTQGNATYVPGQGIGAIAPGVTRYPSANLTALNTVNVTLGGQLYAYGTPWYEITFTPPVSGTYRLVFAVTNAKAGALTHNESALLFDRLRVEQPDMPVPEPSTAALVLVGAGLIAMGWLRRR